MGCGTLGQAEACAAANFCLRDQCPEFTLYLCLHTCFRLGSKITIHDNVESSDNDRLFVFVSLYVTYSSINCCNTTVPSLHQIQTSGVQTSLRGDLKVSTNLA